MKKNKIKNSKNTSDISIYICIIVWITSLIIGFLLANVTRLLLEIF